MSKQLQLHDEILARVIGDCGGTVFKTVGDAFCAHFASAVDAITCAIAIQRSILADLDDCLLRCALDEGEVEIRGSDLFGPTLSRVARLLRVTQGGQILATRGVCDTAGDEHRSLFSYRDIGDVRIKDLPKPIRAVQIIAEGLPDSSSPPPSDGGRLGNIPKESSEFIGREVETEEVIALIRAHPLVTLTGAGGSGKTRLALRVGKLLEDDFRDSAYLIDLSSCDSHSDLTALVIEALSPGDMPLSLQDLAALDVLLIVDNCEHIVPAVGALCRAIHSVSPGTRLLATSRAQLGAANEFAYRIPPLGLPEASGPLSLHDLQQYDATKLFLSRAASSDTRYEFSDADAQAIAEICMHLDGMPLAIEMAAARIRSFTPVDILKMLSQRFRLLTSGAAAPVARHQALRTTIDWSYDLLTEAERESFARLSVFSGSFLLDAAQDILDSSDAVLAIGALVDHSLLVSIRTPGGRTRFRYLETIRDYADEKLGASEYATSARLRHLRHYSDFAMAAEPHVQGPEAQDWIERIDADVENVRAALDSSEVFDPRAGLEMAVCLTRYWYVRGAYGEGLRRLQSLLALCDAQGDAVVAKAYNGIGILAVPLGQLDTARSALEVSLSIRRDLGDLQGVAANLSNIGLLLRQSGDVVGAKRSFADAIEQYEAIGYAPGLAMALGNLGGILNEMGSHAEAVGVIERALAIDHGIVDEWTRAVCLANLGESLFRSGNHADGRARLLESLELSVRIDDPEGMHYSTAMLAVSAHAQGNKSEAASLRAAADRLAGERGVDVQPATLGELGTISPIDQARAESAAGISQSGAEFFDEVQRLARGG
jgi:predicted ATPase